jgi:hypothetical protein
LLGGIVGYSALTGGSGHTPGTYYNVKLYNDLALSEWNGATAKVTVSGSGSVTNAEIIANGSAYTNNSTLYFDSLKIGGSASARITVSTSGISTSIGDVVQIAGAGTTTSNQYYRITSLPATNQIAVARTSGDASIASGQYALVIGPSVKISSTSYTSNTGLLTVNSSSAHGLLAGNRFRIIDSSNNNLGDYVVNERISLTSFTAFTYKSISASNGFILKHGLSANNGVSDTRGENLGVRGIPLYANESLKLQNSITTDTVIDVLPSTVGITTIAGRFPLGSYIQIDNEIMRITTSGSETTFGVIRGSLGTRQEDHDANSIIRKIEPIAVEFRRPSILRASGHTFEYMGFGPGNYSTGLPQVQIRALTDREEFLSQAQERSCGAVIYTGMNNKGDVYSGNTKTIASSGEIISYDIPKPTVTGQDPTKLSVVFDEVTVKERLLVEGGASATVLSQFNGPLTLNGQLRVKAKATFSRQVKISNTTPSTNKFTGALIINGGVGILENINVGGIGSFSNSQDSTTIANGSIVTNGGVGIEKRLNVGGAVGFTSTTDSTSGSTGAFVITGGVGIGKNLNVSGITNAENSTDSTLISNGSLTVQGGVGIRKRLNVGGAVGFTSTTDSTSTTSGALIVTGGVGIGKTVFIGGSLNVALTRSTTLGGTLSVVGNTNLSGTLGVAAGQATDLGGTLNVDGATTLQSTLDVTGSSTFNSNTTINGILDVNSGATIDNIRIGIANDNTIDTSTGGLTLDSSSGTTTISDNTTITGTLDVSANITGSSAISATGNISAGNRLIGQLQRSVRIVGSGVDSTFNNSSDVTVTLPDKTKITVSGSTDPGISNGFRENMTATRQGDADTLMFRGINGGTSVGSGGLTSAGDIIAFASDERLKTNIEPIENAVDKVLKLRGFTYNFNEIGEELGFDASLRHAGVSAQEVQEVLPEAVCPAPASDEYLTVKYEKLVPLLIEAIKELRAEINELRRSK